MAINIFLKQYPITRRVLWFMLLLLLIAIATSSLLLSRHQQEFKNKHHELADQSVKSVSTEIELLVNSIRRSASLFAESHQDLFYELSLNPDNEEILNKLKVLLERNFPEHDSFSLTDLNGDTYIDDYGETIGNLCLLNIQQASEHGHPNNLVVHPGPSNYHFDVMVPWFYQESQQGIFFKSYKLDLISKILDFAQADGQSIFLVKKSEPDLIEITADGGRDIIQNTRDIYLTDQEKVSIGASNAINGSDWQVLAIYQPDLFSQNWKELLYPAAISWLILAFFGVLALLFINKEEKQRQKAELLLQQTNDQLELRVAERTDNLNQTNRQLEKEIERRDKAENTQRILQQATDQSNEIFFITDPNAQIVYANPTFTRSLGYESSEIIGKSVKVIQSGLMSNEFYQDLWNTILNKETFSGVFINRTKEGQLCYMDETITPILDKTGQIEYFIANCLNITSETEHKKHINYLSEHDPLTGLFNRKYLKAYIDDYIVNADINQCLAIIYLSIKRFDMLSEGMGQNKGSLIVKQVSNRLIALKPENHVLAKLSKEDEFVWVMPNCNTADNVTPVISNLLEAFNLPVEIDDDDVMIGLNIGVAFYPEDADNFDQLISNGFAAHNRCKQNLENNYVFYQKGQTEAANQRLIFERDILKALHGDAFEFFYQPKVSLTDGRLIGFESLCRWREETTDFYISPEIFIPLIEELGLISTLCKQGVEDAAEIINSVLQPIDKGLRVAVNLSPLQFYNPEMVDNLQQIMAKNSIAPHSLEFEITENALINDFEQTKRILQQLSQLGCVIALDDFGTGYSSMQYLKELPIDCLKIDKSFVLGMHENKKDHTFIKAIIAMAHGLGLKVIAEGVESQSHMKLLSEFNCDVVQGYYISKPLPGSDLKNWILSYQEKQLVKNDISPAQATKTHSV
jgi:PAS domain S-box-containing protein/diguanylate cyclase (GGDEF)-like protein